ncbi:MAG: response regulator [Burkholderiales bacterium]|nr:response regulator [Burkholderiales bacterium]
MSGTKGTGAHYGRWPGFGPVRHDDCGVDCHGQGGRLLAVILIVEDEMFIRENAEWAIEDLGHIIFSAGDVAEAFLHLEMSENIDALFVDIRLNTAGYGGYEIADRAVKSKPDLRVLYTSGTEFSAEMRACFVEGAHFLQKPYTENQLQNSIEGLLASPS